MIETEAARRMDMGIDFHARYFAEDRTAPGGLIDRVVHCGPQRAPLAPRPEGRGVERVNRPHLSRAH
jgi:hypothetical protein